MYKAAWRSGTRAQSTSHRRKWKAHKQSQNKSPQRSLLNIWTKVLGQGSSSSDGCANACMNLALKLNRGGANNSTASFSDMVYTNILLVLLSRCQAREMLNEVKTTFSTNLLNVPKSHHKKEAAVRVWMLPRFNTTPKSQTLLASWSLQNPDNSSWLPSLLICTQPPTDPSCVWWRDENSSRLTVGLIQKSRSCYLGRHTHTHTWGRVSKWKVKINDKWRFQ